MSNEGTLRTRKFTYNATLAIVIAMVAGYIVGAIGGKPLAQIQFIGDIFFRLVQMGIVPFVMCTIIEAVGGLTARDLSGIGLKGIAWFAGSSVLASRRRRSSSRAPALRGPPSSRRPPTTPPGPRP